MNRLEESRKLIKEGKSRTQDYFTKALMDMKKNNPNMSYNEIVRLLKDEFDRFVMVHSKVEPESSDNTRAPRSSSWANKFVNQPNIPTRRIPFGGGNKRK